METRDYEQFQHAVLPQTSHDEFSRQEFVKSFKFHLATKVSPNNKAVYETHVKPRFEKENGRAPQDRHEVRRAMNGDDHYQMWSSLLRTSQEMMWHACQGPVARQLPGLIDKGRLSNGAGGSLTLDPDLKIPSYHTAVDIHCQPGGYHTEWQPDDLAAGAIYDRAVYIYAMGRMGPLNDDMGASQAAYIKHKFPDLKPQRVLDLGCAAGHSTTPYKTAFPDAEVYAVDVAAPMLRYAHARAESLGTPIHYSQQNAESLNFDDGSFDLIVSHIFVHETSHSALRRSMKECHRLLAPGGLLIHSETPPYKDMDAYDAFILDWDTYNNNEPFWGTSHEVIPAELAAETGFDPEKTFETMAPSVFEAAQSKRTNLFQGGDFGGAGFWYLYGFEK